MVSQNQISKLKRVSEVLISIFSRPSGMIGFSIVILHIIIAIISPLIVPYDYKEINSLIMLRPPSEEFIFGTDQLGRDVFTRTLMGGRVALLVTFFGTLIAVAWGGFVGIFCGLVGGRIDDIVMRVIDAFLAIPWILAMLLIVVILGTSTQVLIPALGFFYGKGIVRVALSLIHI